MADKPIGGRKEDWHQPASEATKLALENAVAGREPGSDDDLKSIGELLEKGGWRPHPVPKDCERSSEYWQRRVDEHWAIQAAKVHPTLLRNGVPGRFVSELASMKSPKSSSAIDRVQLWGESKSLMLVLSGDPQVGKSFACAWWLSSRSKIIRSQYGTEPVLPYRYVDSDYEWVQAPQLAGFRDRFDPEVRAKQNRLDRIGVLIVDEVGGASLGDVSKALEALLIRRWSENRRTVMTTNLDTNAFAHEVGERVFERMRQGGGEFYTVGPLEQLGLPL